MDHQIFMVPLEAEKYVSKELLKERARIVILSGSAARENPTPSDLDIAAVFPYTNTLLNVGYRRDLIKRLSVETGYKIDLIDFNQKHIDNLVEQYNKDARKLCWDLNDIVMDNVRDQWKGWPLAWIFGDKAEEMLDPYGCFQKEMIVLEGQNYLDELRSRISSFIQ